MEKFGCVAVTVIFSRVNYITVQHSITAPQLTDSCQPRAAPLLDSATCAGTHLAAVQSYQDHRSTLYSVAAAIARTPSLPGRWLPWFRGSLHHRLCCRSCLALPRGRVASQSRVWNLSSSQCSHGTSCLTDDVVAAVGFRSQVSEEQTKHQVFKSRSQ